MRKLVIVGGGSAGWITASYLNGALNAQGNEKNIDITLVESPDVPRITVGEATIPNIVRTLQIIGIDETEFMKSAEATFKQSIRFVDWEKKDGSSYHHPFNIIRTEPIDDWSSKWLNSLRDIPYVETVSDQARICEMDFAPKMLGEWRFGPPFKYAYHMNALKFADYLCEFSTNRGVQHILANVEEVNVSEKGLIKSVSLDNEQTIEGDVFVDCTGFKSLLLGQALKVPFNSFSQWLLCDQAIVAQFPYEKYYPGKVRPYTTATALSAGWVWDIPMQTRRSVGYVHSSQYIDSDKAVEELFEYQGADLNEVDVRTVKFQVGQRQKAWQGNCIAIGLAGGFVEPLESTGLYLCDEAATILAEHFPYRDEDFESLSYRFNRIISNRYYEILDFINLHYCLTKRNDTQFWREVQKSERINDRLQAKLEYWKIKEPSAQDFMDQAFMAYMPVNSDIDGIDPRPPIDTGRLWNYESYRTLLYGMHHEGGVASSVPPQQRTNSQTMPFVKQRVDLAPKALPKHDVWLKKVLNMQDWPEAKQPKGWT